MYAVLGKKGIRITAFVCLLVAVFVAEAVTISANDRHNDIRKPQAREEFLANLGVAVDEDSFSEVTVTVPETFSDVYENYNELQRSTGYDLSAYRGKTVLKYTYCLKDRPNTVINILCYRGRVIGGDISETELSGVIRPLIKQEKENYGTDETG